MGCVAPVYRPRDAEHTVLHQVVVEHLEAFLDAVAEAGDGAGLPKFVEEPLSEGYTTDLWTLPRIATLIRKHFRTRYHPGHVWRVMRGLGWTCQKPERRALKRDENAIARWKTQAWPRIKQSPKTWGPSRLPRRKRLPPHP